MREERVQDERTAKRAKPQAGARAGAARPPARRRRTSAARPSGSSSEIEAAEAALKALEEELADPAAWSSPDRSAKSTRRHDAAKRELKDLYARWEASGERWNGTYRSVAERSPNGHPIPQFAGKIAGMTTQSETQAGHPGRPALPLDRLGGLQARRPARAGPAGVRHAARGGLRAGQAPRHGLRDDHRPRHDRRRARDRRPPRRVRLRGADRALRAASRRPCTSSASASRPTTTSGCRRTRATSRQVAEYLREQEIACALAHPFYAVEAPLTAAAPAAPRRAVRRLGGPQRRPRARAQRARRRLRRHPRRHRHRRLRRPRRGRHRPHVDRGARGEHAGRVPRPPARRPRRRARQAGLGGQVGARRDGDRRCAPTAAARARRPTRAVVLRMIERVMSEGDARSGALAADIGPDDARALLRAWLAAIDLDLPERELLELHAGRRLQPHRALPPRPPLPRAQAPGRGRARAGDRVGRRRRRLGRGRRRRSSRPASPPCPTRPRPPSWAARSASSPARDGDPPRVALVADGIGATHGVTRTLEELRERGVPGFEVEVIGTDGHVDRRLPSVTEADVPFYAGDVTVGVPGPAGCRRGARRGPLRPGAPVLARPGRHRRRADRAAAGAADGRLATTPSWPPTRGRARATRRSSCAPQLALAAFYGSCDVVLSPSSSVDERLAGARHRDRPDRALGPRRRPRAVHARTARARRSTTRRGSTSSTPAGSRARRAPTCSPTRSSRAHRLRPALHLVIAGGGPEEPTLRERLGDRATFLGWLEGDALATAYASADLFLFCSQTDTYGQVLLEAQASGLPVVAVAAGGPAELVAPRPQRAAVPARRGRARAHARRPGRLPLGAPAADRRRAAGGRGAHLGGRARPPGGGLAARPGGRGHATAAGGEHHGRRVRRGGTSRAEGSLPQPEGSLPVRVRV